LTDARGRFYDPVMSSALEAPGRKDQIGAMQDRVQANPSFALQIDRQPVRLYTPEERSRRDQTVWTLVQGVLAPVQFLVFLVSLWLVLSYLMTGTGYESATASIVVKTLVLYTIMITGSIWEKVVFGRYLFAPAFFWEDVFSMLVLALHTAYLAALFFHLLDPTSLMLLALAAYVTYVINAAQFILKLRAARLQSASDVSALPLLNAGVMQ
jgi:3-vinyl bacteriochlorophyllide hydratase